MARRRQYAARTLRRLRERLGTISRRTAATSHYDDDDDWRQASQIALSDGRLFTISRRSVWHH